MFWRTPRQTAHAHARAQGDRSEAWRGVPVGGRGHALVGRAGGEKSMDGSLARLLRLCMISLTLFPSFLHLTLAIKGSDRLRAHTPPA